jgi:hypothetical protein
MLEMLMISDQSAGGTCASVSCDSSKSSARGGAGAGDGGGVAGGGDGGDFRQQNAKHGDPSFLANLSDGFAAEPGREPGQAWTAVHVQSHEYGGEGGGATGQGGENAALANTKNGAPTAICFLAPIIGMPPESGGPARSGRCGHDPLSPLAHRHGRRRYAAGCAPSGRCADRVFRRGY